MKKDETLTTAHGETVNSVFVNFNAGVVISVDEESIRLWDPVNGTEIFETGMKEDTVIPGLGHMYRIDTDLHLDS